MKHLGRFTTLSIVALAVIAILLLPDENNTVTNDAPWEITITPSGNSHLLGVTIGESQLSDAQIYWKEDPEITLFLPENGVPKVEAYFQRIETGGLRASIVAEIMVE